MRRRAPCRGRDLFPLEYGVIFSQPNISYSTYIRVIFVIYSQKVNILGIRAYSCIFGRAQIFKNIQKYSANIR